MTKELEKNLKNWHIFYESVEMGKRGIILHISAQFVDKSAKTLDFRTKLPYNRKTKGFFGTWFQKLWHVKTQTVP